MKKTFAFILTCVFCLGALTVSGCGNPCEKAFDKMIECFSKDDDLKGIAEEMKKQRESFVEECKKDKAKVDIAKKCNKESDCAKFMECFK